MLTCSQAPTLCRHSVTQLHRRSLPDVTSENLLETVANVALGLATSGAALKGPALLAYPALCQGASLAASEVTKSVLFWEVAPAVALGEPQSKGVLLRFDVGGGGKGEAG